MDQLPEDAPQPRLCHLTKWPDFDGFGFNLQLGQFIGKVDDDSPAQHAQLREGDRIIEVNGVNIANENHRQVVERIKAIPNETRLLVLDRAGDRYYRERNLHVHGAQSNVLHCRTPNPRPAAVTTELIVSTHDDPMIVPNEHVVPLDTKQVQLHVPEVHVPNDKEETQIQNLANQQVTQVIVEATSRMQQNSTRPYDESHVQVNSKSSLELPIDNQQTIQALNDAGEQLHSLKLTTPAIDEKRSQVCLDKFFF